jgi:hypothetical protein
MPEMSEVLYYDGALRPRDEVARRVSADVTTFLDDAVRRYGQDAREWRSLFAGVRLSDGRTDACSAAEVCSFELACASLVVTPFSHYRGYLVTIFAAAVAAPWCARASLEAPSTDCFTGRIHVTLGSFDAITRSAVEGAIRMGAEKEREEMRRGVDSLVAMVGSDALPTARAALNAALLEITSAELAKQRRLQGSSER